MLVRGSTIAVPAHVIDSRPSAYEGAWSGRWQTIQLEAHFEVIRVSPWEQGLAGDWFAIDDGIQTRPEYTGSHALPGMDRHRHPRSLRPFRFQAICTLSPGTVLNVGRCAPLFDQLGGGYQAEFLDGPRPDVCPILGTWSNRMGNA